MPRAGFDQRGGDIDRVVIAAAQIFDSSGHRLTKPLGQLGGFRDPHRASFELFRALVEHPFENKGHRDAAR